MGTMEMMHGDTTDRRRDWEILGEDDQPSSSVPVRKSDVVRAVQAILRQAQRSRLPCPALSVVPCEADEGSFEVACGEEGALEALGDLVGARGGFAPRMSSRLPVTSGLKRKFQKAFPPSRVVRVDTQAGYLDFLEKRLERLEKALLAHAADGHGGPVVIGERVPISLPPGLRDKFSAWQDGGEIACSMKFNAGDGRTCVATTGTPAWRHVEEVVGYADEAGVEPALVVGVLPVVAQILGAGSLVDELRAIVPALRGVSGRLPFVGRTVSGDASTVGALVSLLQRARMGDKRASEEVERVRASASGADLLEKAESVLDRALYEKNALSGRRVL